MKQKNNKIKEIIRELAANFFSKTSNRQSMITVTDISLNNKSNKAEILITVLPETMTEKALNFAHRQLSEFREYVKENSRLARIPYFEVKLDIGEKNRQRIEDISNNIK